ncbi:MAG: uroporphyrinogen-III synthase [Chlamydiia bacterium]|nr:uroporphyrinogen-III synthase [Chlamydiia bacterium]
MPETAYFGLRLPKDMRETADHIPLIQITPTESSHPLLRRALRSLEDFSHVILTSRTTVELLFGHFGVSPVQLQNATIIAVGQATARACEQHGLRVHHTAEKETAEGVIRVLKSLHLRGSYVFWPHSAQARHVILNYLLAAAIPNLCCPLYRTEPRRPEDLPDLKQYSNYIFTSPSTVHAFTEVFGRLPEAGKSQSIGPVTAKALKKVLTNSKS